MISTLDPTNGKELARFAPHTSPEVAAKLARAAEAQAAWRRRSVEDRATFLPRLAMLLRTERVALATLITTEMGKPIGEALAEVEKCALNCDFYAGAAPGMLADAPVRSVPGTSISFEPIGVILAIMPWNYPLWQVMRFAAPALVAGNGAILKHAANVPQSALALEKLIIDAGFPEGLFANIFVEAGSVAAIIADPHIAAVTLTGSTEVGAIVAGQAGAALKKQVLELGGSDPFVVLADADLDRAARMAVTARFTNAGQSCVNAKRFIIEASVADRFVERFLALIADLRMGDPHDAATTLGPLARANLRQTLHSQVERSVAAGARLLTGGALPEGPGFYYPPTLLDHVTPGMAAFDEETFGPAAAIVRAADAEQALTLANRTAFGLGASIWTADTTRGRAFARRIDAGAVFVNTVVASDPRVPFGGIKRSGYGRELGEHGLKEFTNIKSIRVEEAA